MGFASTHAKNLIGCILSAREMQLGQKMVSHVFD